MAAPEPPSAIGPPVHVVGMFPRDGCGVGDSECTFPTNAPITLRFDRFLDPARVNRDTIRVYTGDRELGSPFWFDVVYDPIERVVEYRLGSSRPYRPRTLYQYEVLVPATPTDAGLRAFDGALLEEGDIPLRGSFVTSDEPAEIPTPPPAPTCRRVVDELFRGLGRCAGSECHRYGGNQHLETMADLGGAPHQLWLDTPESFALSAVNRVARQTEVGDFSGGVAAERPLRFGVRMALVRPQNPGASYLLYKLLLHRDNYEPCPKGATSELCALPGPCETAHPALPLPRGECLQPSEEELVRLREWFVRGEPMPRPNSQGISGNLQFQGLRAISSFIASGAADCSR